jgi:hypothetical protein
LSVQYNSRIVTDSLVLALDAANPKNYNLTAVEVLVVAGGGGGGMDMGGGGGGGGVIYNPNVAVTPGSPVTVTVGAGGYGAPAGGGGYRTDGAGPQPNFHQFTIPATNGGNSVFGGLTAIGGGAGGSSYRGYTPGIGGANGGSGGGSSGYNDNAGTFYGGTGTSGQGFAGGNSTQAYYSGGGGGAGGPGVSSPNRPDGGPGILYSTMSPYYFGGGGGGASYSLSTGGYGGIGGGGGGALGTTYGGAGLNNGSAGGGGGPNQWANTPGGNAGANTGGGGGGGSHYNANNKGGEGGSGIVIIRYPGPQRAIGGTVTSSGGHTIHTFTTVGSTTFTPLVATNNSAILGLADFSGNNNFGTTQNSPLYSSSFGGSVSFDGTNEYVEIVNNNGFGEVSTTPTITLELWANIVRKSGGGTQYQQLAGFRNDIDFSFFFLLLDASGASVNTEARIQTTSGVFDVVASYLPYFNVWTHIVFTANVNRIDLYFNGNLVGSNTNVTGSFGSTSGNFRVGLSPGGAWSTLGNISSVKVYNRALTASEIQQNFNALRGRFGI